MLRLLLTLCAICCVAPTPRSFGYSCLVDTTLTLYAEILDTQLPPPVDALTDTTFVAVTFLPTYLNVFSLYIAFVPAACSSGTGTISVSLWRHER